jgi:DNA invertase Pin-like site-specific DNA recombinase
MSVSDLITQQHLTRTAVIYVRQSTQQQVINNQESLRLQYALSDRARDLGWHERDILIIDSDLGLTGAAAVHREGFKDLIARVTLGQVGIILSFDVTRLSRNCSDWYPLLDLCGYKGCLIADRDGVYDPGSPNGRLLLGLKGAISEVELFTIRARLNAGVASKASRGDLMVRLPAGFIRTEDDVVRKDPNLEVQRRIELIFATFLRVGSAAQVVCEFAKQDLMIPRRRGYDDVVWKRPEGANIALTLKNPAYAGAFAYGRTRRTRGSAASDRAQKNRLPQEHWRYLVKDKYPSYISWETYEAVQRMLADNYAEYEQRMARGVPRTGAALLQGIVCCGRCGKKMAVRYQSAQVYICNRLQRHFHVSQCQSVSAAAVDASVAEAFLEAISPVQFDAYERAMIARRETDDQIERARAQQVERVRYQAALAERQFLKVDPDNRLVASELERRWESALRELREAEAALSQRSVHTTLDPTLIAELKSAFCSVGEKLPQIWDGSLLCAKQKKALLRCLIDKVVVVREPRDTIQARIVWKGGDVSTLAIPVHVNSLTDLSNVDEMTGKILELSRQGRSDQEIAAQLTTEGFRSAKRERVGPWTVKRIRLQRGVLINGVAPHPRRVTGFLTTSQVADALGVRVRWIITRIKRGEVRAQRDERGRIYLFPDEPDTLERLRQYKAGHMRQVDFRDSTRPTESKPDKARHPSTSQYE